MTKYRCVVFQSTGNYVPYSGLSFMAASDAFEDYRSAGLRITIERDDGSGWLEAVSYQPGKPVRDNVTVRVEDLQIPNERSA